MNAFDIRVIGQMSSNGLAEQVAAVDWPRVDADQGTLGAAVIERLLTQIECHELSSLYQRDDAFAVA